MIQLDMATIEAAKANDLAATTAVIQATEERVCQIAARTARTNADLREDLEQIGRMAVWESLSRFTGATVAEFFTYMDRTVSGAITDARKEETRPGVSRSVAQYFERALSLAGGDPYEAEKLSQDKNLMSGHQLSAEMAYAARLSWMGVDSLDRPTGDESGMTLGDVVAEIMELPIELVTSDDITAHRRKAKIRAVHRTLSKMSDRRRHVLCADHGITGTPYFGGPDVKDAELGEQMGLTAYQVKQARTFGMKQFREMYLAGENVF